MSADNKRLYLNELKKVTQQIHEEETFHKKIKLEHQLDECHVNYLEQDKKTKKLYNNQQDITKRKLAEPELITNIQIKDVYSIWVAPHELKDYGDSDELIYRKFFREGYIRIELHVPDVNGEVGKKIFYIPDNEYLPSEPNEKRILVSEKDWKEYKC